MRVKKKKRSNQNLILNLVSLIVFSALIAYLVLANGVIDYNSATLNAPVSGGNYSAKNLFTFNCSTDLINATNINTNVSLMINTTGGNAWNGSIINLSTTINGSATQSAFQNSSINISGLLGDLFTEGKNRNLTCWASNGTQYEFSASANNVTIDSTPPNVTSFVNTLDGGNYTGNRTFNVSVDDLLIGVESVYFNVTNASGGELATFGNWTRAYATDGQYYNVTFDTSVVSDGPYNVTIWANDTNAGNLNNSESIRIVVDNTGPSVALTKTSSSTNSIIVDIDVTESGSGTSSCTVDRSDTATVTGSLNSWTITESDLAHGTAYTYVVTCTDYAGSSTQATLATSTDSSSGSPAGNGGGGDGGRATTYAVSEGQLKTGFTKELKTNDKMKFEVSGSDHQVSVAKLTETTATIEISSDPQTATLSLGDIRKFDLTANGYYDLQATLNGISNNRADITIKAIHEEVTKETIAQEAGKEEEALEAEAEKKKIPYYLIIIAIIIIIIIVAVIIYKKKQR